MPFTEKISLVVDVVTGGTTSGISKLKAELDSTDGAFNKMKVAGTGAFDLIKQNAGALALGAGTALAAFGVKAVSAFQETALGAGHMSDALGVSVEEASRLQEVAGDLGIGVGTLESAMGKMNKAAAATPEAFRAIGAEIAKNADGTTNVTKTFLNAIDALNKMPDATARAEAGAKIFGRGWMEIAGMVELGADGMQKALDSVETGKIMTADDYARAKKFRDVLDELSGIAEEAAVAIGERIVPVLQTAAELFLTLKGAVEDLLDVLPEAAEEAGFDPFSSFGDIAADFQRNAKVILEALGIIDQEQQAVESSSEGLATALALANRPIENLIPIAGALTGGLRDAAGGIEEVAESTKAATRNLIPFAGALDDVVAGSLIPFAAGMRDVADAAVEADATFGEIRSALGEPITTGEIVDSVKAVSDEMFALKNISMDYEAALDSMNTALDENGASFDVSTEKGRANEQALQALGGTLIPEIAANFEAAGGSLQAFATMQADSAARLKQGLIDNGVAAEQAQQIVDRLIPLDDVSIQTQFELTGADVAAEKVEQLIPLLAALELSPDVLKEVAVAIAAGKGPEEILEIIKAGLAAGTPPDVEVEVTAPGATESTAQLRETDIAARDLSDEEQVVTTAPGATESTAQLRETDQTARAMTDAESVATSAPGATESTAQLRETDRTARAMTNAESVETSAPGAITARDQLQNVDDTARSIPGSRNVTVSADDNATGILGRIRDAIDAIRSKTVTIGVNYVPIGGSLLAGGSKSSQPGDIAGEAGPEMLRFKSGRQAIVNEPTILPGGVEVTPFGRGGFGHRVGVGGGVFDERNPKMDRGGDIYYINVVAPLGQHPAEFGRRISEAIRDYEKINGPAWRS